MSRHNNYLATCTPTSVISLQAHFMWVSFMILNELQVLLIEPGSGWLHGYMHLITKLCVFGMVTTACRPGYSHFGLQNLTFHLNMDEGAYTVQLCLVCNLNLHSIINLTMYNTCLWSFFPLFLSTYDVLWPVFLTYFSEIFPQKIFFSLLPEDFFYVLLQPFWTWCHHKTFCCCHFDVRA